MAIALVLGIWATHVLHYDQNQVILYFLAPYYTLAAAMQYVWPHKANNFEPNEVLTDWLNNGALLVVTAIQGFMVRWMEREGSGLLFEYGWLDASWSAGNLPFWAQVLVAMLVFDFMFYVTHRMAHNIDFFWRFHSVHHSAHRLSFLNASRVHPIDLVWRRLLPLFVTYQAGVSADAIILANTLASTLAVITHMNVAFDFGVLNYLIGTNQMHRWHHSNKIEEAKNFSIILFWDHMFGTFVYPKGRIEPDKMGLFNERFYPIHNFWGQLFIPFTWKSWKAKQLREQEAGSAAHVVANTVSVPSPPVASQASSA